MVLAVETRVSPALHQTYTGLVVLSVMHATPTLPELSCMIIARITLSSTPILAASLMALKMHPISLWLALVWSISCMLMGKSVMKSFHVSLQGKEDVGPEKK